MGSARRSSGGAPGTGARALPLALAAGLAAGPLPAHDFWIEPSGYRPAVGARVALALRVGEAFRGQAVPRDPARIDSFRVVGPGGGSPVAGLTGLHPAGFTTVEAAGPHLVSYRSRPARIELAAPAFEAYLRQEGLDRISDLRRRRGGSSSPGREIYSRSAKALLCAGGGGAAGRSDRVLGLPLEIVPQGDLCRLAPGSELSVRLLFAGRPLAGGRVAALSRGAPAAELAARSDGEGRVRFLLERPGPWLLTAVHMEPAAPGSGADWESWWASLTFGLGGE